MVTVSPILLSHVPLHAFHPKHALLTLSLQWENAAVTLVLSTVARDFNIRERVDPLLNPVTL